MGIDLRRPGWWVLAFAVGAIAGLVLLRDPSGELTSERLAEARGIWAEHALRSYTLELEVRGALNEQRTVVVRDGRVTEVSSAEVTVPESTWEYWSVEGLFDTLRTELRNAEEPMRSLGAQDVALLARFDPTWGYPSYFYRHIMGRSHDIEWKVVGFTPNS